MNKINLKLIIPQVVQTLNLNKEKDLKIFLSKTKSLKFNVNKSLS